MTKYEQKLVCAVKSVPSIAEKEQWVITLDNEEGTLFYSPKRIADGAELRQVTDEYALYVDKNFVPKGVVVEYFKNNFMKHHKLINRLSSKIFNGRKTIEVINPNARKNNLQIASLKALLESAFLKEADINLIRV